MADQATELLEAVAQLRTAVEDMKTGSVDRETVERIAEEAALRSAAAAPKQGYTPADTEDEAELVSALGGSTEERMIALQTRDAAQVAHVTKFNRDNVELFQRASDRLVLASVALRQDPRRTNLFKAEYLPALRAVNVQVADEGKIVAPVGLSASMLGRVDLQTKVAALFAGIAMPTNPYDMPSTGARLVRKRLHLAEQTGDTGQKTARKVTPKMGVARLEAVEIAVEALVSRSATEDSVIPLLGWIEAQLIDAIVADWEDLVLNSGKGGFDGNVDDEDTLTQLNGLRKYAVDLGTMTDGGGDAITVADLRANRRSMGKFGVNPAQLAHIVSIDAYLALLDDEKVMTIDKYGSAATILSGELAKVDGTPIIVSEFVREDLDAATGQIDEDGTTTAATTVWTPGFVQGSRRETDVQLLDQVYAEAGQNAILCTARKGFTGVRPNGEKVVAVRRNLKVGA